MIPTYGREKVLLDTVEMFLKQSPQAKEVLIIDQTKSRATDGKDAGAPAPDWFRQMDSA